MISSNEFYELPTANCQRPSETTKNAQVRSENIFFLRAVALQLMCLFLLPMKGLVRADQARSSTTIPSSVKAQENYACRTLNDFRFRTFLARQNVSPQRSANNRRQFRSSIELHCVLVILNSAKFEHLQKELSMLTKIG